MARRDNKSVWVVAFGCCAAFGLLIMLVSDIMIRVFDMYVYGLVGYVMGFVLFTTPFILILFDSSSRDRFAQWRRAPIVDPTHVTEAGEGTNHDAPNVSLGSLSNPTVETDTQEITRGSL